MRIFLISSLIIQFLTVCSVQSDEVADSLVKVSGECESGLTNIISLKGFKEFMKHYNIVTEKLPTPKWGILNGKAELRKCFKQKEQLTELDKLISNQEDGACRLDYLDKLVDYHIKYVIKVSKLGKRPKLDDRANVAKYSPKTTYAAHIFSLFAHQVAYNCKSKLLERVSDLESRYSCKEVLNEFLPVQIKRAIVEREDYDIAGKIQEFLDNFRRVEDFMLLSRKTTPVKSEIDVIAPPEIEVKIKAIIGLCKAREPYYSALFLPVSILSQLGYDVSEIPESSFDLNSDESKTLKCWLATAQLCQGVLKVHIARGSFGEDKDFVKIKFNENQPDAPESISAGSSPDPMRYKDSIDEITSSIAQLVHKKKSLSPGKLKRTLKWAKKFFNLVRVDASQNEMASHIIDSLIRGDDDLDAPVQLAGRPSANGIYTGVRMLADDSDTAAAVAGVFVPGPFAFFFSGCVGVAMSGVLVYFLISAAAVTATKKTLEVVGLRKPHDSDPLSGNFKESWLKEKDRQMGSLKDTVERKSLWRKSGVQVYIGTSN